MDLATIIREARARSGLTQRALAAELGITHGAIGQWEGGDTRPSFATLLRVCAVLGIPLDGLIGPGTPYQGEIVEDPEERRLLAAWRDLPAEKRRFLLELVGGARNATIPPAIADRRNPPTPVDSSSPRARPKRIGQ